MACARCMRWQRHVRMTKDSMQLHSKRKLSTTSRCNEATEPTPGNTQSRPDKLELAILQHKRRFLSAPNDRPRSAVHDIDVSKRLGTKYSRPVIGAMEWQTSTYHYNKQTSKAYPVVAQNTNKLLEAYAALEVSSGGKSKSDIRAIADRRKVFEKVYVSPVKAKDYGNKIVLDVFVHDAKEAAKRAFTDRAAQKTAATDRRAARRATGAATTISRERRSSTRTRTSSTTGFKPAR